jgi:SagB-type dehydrogenase family enzyme
MRSKGTIAGVVLILVGLGIAVSRWSATPLPVLKQEVLAMVELPRPKTDGGMSLTESLAKRRSIRYFTGKPLEREQISQLCWAAQGISDPAGKKRTAPSAGATYPLRLYVATPDGFYLYSPERHGLELIGPNDLRQGIADAAGQSWLSEAGAIFVICGNVPITAAKYEDRATRYVWQETGHAAQNLLLQATSLGLGATPVGAYQDDEVQRLLHLSGDWQPLYVLPVGVPQ